jgi:hypothetical protein
VTTLYPRSTAMTDTYRQEDVQQILQLAIARQVETEELTRAQLFEIADELGISAADLVLAEQEWQVQCSLSQERQDFNRYRVAKLKQNLTRFAIVNGFLIGFNFLTADHLTWSLYVVMGWGLPVALNAWKTTQKTGEDYENAFERWCRQRRLKKTVNTLFNRWLKA